MYIVRVYVYAMQFEKTRQSRLINFIRRGLIGGKIKIIEFEISIRIGKFNYVYEQSADEIEIYLLLIT